MRLTVRYNGEAIGRLNDDTGTMLFQYDGDFLSKRIELSPLHLPLRPGAFATKSPFESDLPGLFADSLPDHWGRTIMDRRLREAGLSPQNVSILKRLALVGTGGLGALTYHPADTKDEEQLLDLKEATRFARVPTISPVPKRSKKPEAIQAAGFPNCLWGGTTTGSA